MQDSTTPMSRELAVRLLQAFEAENPADRDEELAFAWAAGLFEGEGYIGTTDSTSLVLVLGSTDRDVVYRFRVIVGCGNIFFERRSQQSRVGGAMWKDFWRWQAHGVTAVALARRLLPFLCERRRARAVELILRRERYEANRRADRVCRGCGVTFTPVVPRTGHPPAFCSLPCRRRLDYRKRVAKYGPVRRSSSSA